MAQKLTKLITAGEPVSPEIEVSPMKTKRDRLLPVWVARNKKAARTRKRLKEARAAAAEAEANVGEGQKAA